MITVTIYDANGDIVQVMDAADETEAALNAPVGGGFAVGDYNDAEYYLDDGVFTAIPPKPDHPSVVFEKDTGAWIDPRDPGQIAVDLYQARYHTNTDKNMVFYRLSNEGAYPASELADDTTYFPATVEEYLETLAPAEHDLVKAALKYEPNIWRLHPHLIGDVGVIGFIPWLLSEKSVTITDEQLDTIFEVPVPAPLYTGA